MRTTTLLIGSLLFYITAFTQDLPVETVVQTGHSDDINALQFSPDGRFFVTGSQDNTLKIWDTRLGVEMRTLSGHNANINAIAINPDGSRIYSASGFIGGAEIKIWDSETGLELRSIDPEEAYVFTIRDISLHNTGSVLAIADDKINVKLVDSKKGKLIRELDTEVVPRTVVFSHNGNYIAAGGGDEDEQASGDIREIKIWDTRKYNLHKTFSVNSNKIKKLRFSKNDKLLACLSVALSDDRKYKNQLSVFDFNSGEIVYNITDEGWEIEDFAISPDGKYIAYPQSKFDTSMIMDYGSILENYAVKIDFDDKEQIHVHDCEQKTLLRTIETNEFRIYSIGFSPDNTTLVANGDATHFWSTSNWNRGKEIMPQGYIERLIMGPGETAITTIKYDNNIKSYLLNQFDLSNFQFRHFFDTLNNLIYDPVNDQYIRSRNSRLSVRSSDQYDEVGVIADSINGWNKIDQMILDQKRKNIICINKDLNDIYIGSLENHGKTNFLTGHKKPVNVICYHSEKHLFASGSDDRKVLLWDLDKLEKTKELVGHNDNILSLAFDPSGVFLSSGSADGIIRIWDAEKGDRISLLRGHDNDVNALLFRHEASSLVSGSGNTFSLFGGKSEIIFWDTKKSKIEKKITGNEGYTGTLKQTSDKRFLLSTGNDPFVRFYDIETGTDILSYLPIDKDNFIVFTPDNYYATTKSGIQNIYFIRGLEIYTFENFDLKFNRPDVILQRLGYAEEDLIQAYHRAYLKRLKKLDFTEEMLSSDFHIPEIKIINHEEIPEKTAEREIFLNLQANDERYELDRINVWINDVPVYGLSGIDLRSVNAKSFDKEIDLELAPGQNTIQVSVLNKKGAESLKQSIEIQCEKTSVEKSMYIAAIGASQFADSQFNLTYADKDAEDLINMFREGNGVYNNIVVKLITNDDVTKENLSQIRSFFEQAGRDDVIMLFIAGHGLLDENFDYYFATYDMDFNNPSESGIEYSEIEALLDGLKAIKKILIMDTCHSGEVDEEELEVTEEKVIGDGNLTFRASGTGIRVKKAMGLNKTNELVKQLFSDIRKGTGTTVISSAGGAEYAFEGSIWNNGLFTFCILEGMQSGNADLNEDGSILVSELREYVTNSVAEYSNGKQTPTSRIENIRMDFRIW